MKKITTSFGVLLAAIVLVGAGCSFTGGEDGSQKPNPLSIEVAKGESTARDFILDEGGRIELDGHVLTMPGSSLALGQEITMNTVTGVTNSPADEGFVTAVDLQPSGTALLSPATLTMEIPEGTATDELMGFAYEGDGEEFYLFPIEVEGTTATFTITEFSGYGILEMPTIKVEGYLKVVIPTNPHHQRLQEMAVVPSGEAFNILQEWYHEQVLPKLKNAQKDEGQILDAIRQYTSWLAQVQLRGMDDQFTEEAEEALNAMAIGIANAVDVAHDKCIQEKDPLEASSIVFWAKAAQVFGLEEREGLKGEEIKAKIRECAVFEVSYESEMTWTFPNLPTEVSHSTGIATIRLNEALTNWEGTGELQETYPVWQGITGCDQEKVINHPFEVPLALLDIKTTPEGFPSITIDMVIVNGPEGDYAPDVTEVCDIPGFHGSVTQPDPFLIDFDTLHEEEYIGYGGSGNGLGKLDWGERTAYQISNWAYLNEQGKFAQRQYIRSEGYLSGTTTFTIKHTP